jgi:hypothetical protein
MYSREWLAKLRRKAARKKKLEASRTGGRSDEPGKSTTSSRANSDARQNIGFSR